MTILYKPVKIETAEQAEALPEGSLVRDVRSGFDYRARHALGGYLQADLDAGVDVEALVHIEAEEEKVRDISPEVGAYGPDDEIPEHYLGPPRTRYTTPWEEA